MCDDVRVGGRGGGSERGQSGSEQAPHLPDGLEKRHTYIHRLLHMLFTSVLISVLSGGPEVSY